MAKESGLGEQIYVAGYDLSGDVGAIQKASGRRALLEVTGIDKSAPERICGLRDGDIAFNSWYNPSPLQQHVALSPLPQTDVVVIYSHGAAVGVPAASIIAKEIDYGWQRNNDGSLQASINAQANGFGLEWCQMLTAGKRTDGGAVNGASIDLGAVSTLFGLSAYLEVMAFTGTSATIKLQDSADNITFADVTGAAFVAVVAAPNQQRIETALTATVRRYVRVVSTGTFSNLVFACAFCRYLAARD